MAAFCNPGLEMGAGILSSLLRVLPFSYFRFSCFLLGYLGYDTPFFPQPASPYTTG